MQSVNKLIYSEHSIPFITSVHLFLPILSTLPASLYPENPSSSFTLLQKAAHSEKKAASSTGPPHP